MGVLSAYILTGVFSAAFLAADELGAEIITMSAMLVFLSVSFAAAFRGYNRRLWNSTPFVSLSWALEDVDPDEFVDGPIELEVPER